MRNMIQKLTWSLVILLAPALGACDDNGATGPGSASGGAVSLSVAVPAAQGGAFSAGAGFFDVVQNDGLNETVISSVTLVLRDIELERQFDDDCDDHLPGEDDNCEEFSSGAMLLSLPLDGSVNRVVTIDNVPADTYDEVEFEIHKPEDNTPDDLQFILEHPDFADISIRAEGTFNGDPFVYVSDLNQDQEYALIPPIVVNASSSAVNVTLTIDVTTWFVTPGGTLIDPTSANKGGPNENLVEDNIERSIDLFEDRDLDGDDDSLDD